MGVDEVTGRATGLRFGAPVVYVTLFDYDFSVSGDPSSAIDISTHQVPQGARVIGGGYEVTTTFTTAGADGGLPSLQLVGANDLVAAILVSAASNPWDVDLTKRRPLKGITTNLAAAKHVQILRSTQAISAGVLFGAVEWVRPEESSSGH